MKADTVFDSGFEFEIDGHMGVCIVCGAKATSQTGHVHQADPIHIEIAGFCKEHNYDSVTTNANYRYHTSSGHIIPCTGCYGDKAKWTQQHKTK